MCKLTLLKEALITKFFAEKKICANMVEPALSSAKVVLQNTDWILLYVTDDEIAKLYKTKSFVK